MKTILLTMMISLEDSAHFNQGNIAYLVSGEGFSDSGIYTLKNNDSTIDLIESFLIQILKKYPDSYVNYRLECSDNCRLKIDLSKSKELFSEQIRDNLVLFNLLPPTSNSRIRLRKLKKKLLFSGHGHELSLLERNIRHRKINNGCNYLLSDAYKRIRSATREFIPVQDKLFDELSERIDCNFLLASDFGSCSVQNEHPIFEEIS